MHVDTTYEATEQYLPTTEQLRHDVRADLELYGWYVPAGHAYCVHDGKRQ